MHKKPGHVGVIIWRCPEGNCIHPRIPAIATRRDGDGSGDHDGGEGGDDAEAAEDATIGFRFLLVVPVLWLCLPPP